MYLPFVNKNSVIINLHKPYVISPYTATYAALPHNHPVHHRVGILLYGKKVTIKEIRKWMFYKG
jgi:hypothetical protein